MIESFLICRTFHIVGEYEKIKLIKEKFLFNSFVVVQTEMGGFAGIINSLDLIKKPYFLAGDCISERIKVQKENSLEEVLVMLQESGYNELPVFDGNLFCGVICKNDIIEYLNTYNKRLAQEVEEKTKELKTLNDGKDKLFSIIAHDLRTPLTQLLGLSELLKKKFNTQEKRKTEQYIDLIYSSARNAVELTDNLLTWAMLQKSKFVFRPQKINISAFVKEEIAKFEISAQQKGLVITKEIDDSLCVFADYNMLQIILRNLVSNAIKFTNQGEGVIRLSAIMDEDVIEIAVCDNGIGMADEIKKNIFESLQASTPGTSDEKGTGFGLFLCRDFIEKHGGAIKIESVVNGGTSVTFTLPELTN